MHLKAAGKECQIFHSSHFMNSSLEKMINEMCLDEDDGLERTTTLLKGLQNFGKQINLNSDEQD